MARMKNIRFDIYRAQLSIDDKGHNKYNHAIQKVKEFDTLLPDGWTSSKRASFKLWSKHKEEIEEEMKQSGTQWLLDEIINACIVILPCGTELEYVATAENGWHAVVVNDQVGWISGNYSKLL